MTPRTTSTSAPGSVRAFAYNLVFLCQFWPIMFSITAFTVLKPPSPNSGKQSTALEFYPSNHLYRRLPLIDERPTGGTAVVPAQPGAGSFEQRKPAGTMHSDYESLSLNDLHEVAGNFSRASTALIASFTKSDQPASRNDDGKVVVSKRGVLKRPAEPA